MTILDTSPSIELTPLITLSWGSTTVRYAGYSSNVVVDGNTYLAEPSLEITLAEKHGGLDDKPHSGKILANRAPFNVLKSGFAHAPIEVEIAHCSPSAPDTTFRVFAKGKLLSGTKSPQGNRGLFEFKVSTRKARFDIQLGMFTTTTCQWRFGSRDCGVVIVPEEAEVVGVSQDSFNSLRIQFTGTPDLTERRWVRGYVQLDGLRIMIRAIRDETTHIVLELTRIPPPSWMGETIQVIPGCDKQPSTCNEIWSNSTEFQGPGSSIPAYNPAFASGG